METADQVLIIDDAQQRRHDLSTVLQFMGYKPITTGAAYWEESVSMYGSEAFNAIFLGDFLDAESSLQGILARIQRWGAGIPVIRIKEPLPDNLQSSFKRQVVARIDWPSGKTQLLSSLHYAQVYREQWRQAQQAGVYQQVELFRGLVGKGEKIRKVRSAMTQVADRDVNVLITGESGNG